MNQEHREHHLSNEQIESFRENGFLNYGARVLSDDELNDLRQALDRVMKGESEAQPERIANISAGQSSGNVVTQVVNIWEAEPAFRRHLSHPAIVGMVAQLMGGVDTVRVWHDQVQVKPARVGGPTTWHQDHPYWPVIQPADLVSAWVALEDATLENGCMRMVRRSHKWGPYKGDGTVGSDETTWGPAYDPSQVPEGESVEVVPVPVKAGSVVFHHCLTWHGAPPNPTDQPRPAIAVHYMPGYTRYEPTEKGHLVERHITVNPGEPLTGDHFPTVLDHGRVVSV